MSYVDQDSPELFTGKHVVAKTRSMWIVEQAKQECHVCGDVPNQCDDCLVYAKHCVTEGKINIGSGEDANAYR